MIVVTATDIRAIVAEDIAATRLAMARASELLDSLGCETGQRSATLGI
jgi:hypothetical protein